MFHPSSAIGAHRAPVTAAAFRHGTRQPPRRSRGLLASPVAWIVIRILQQRVSRKFQHSESNAFDSLTRLHLSVSCSSMRRVSPSLRGICIRESRPSSGVFRIVAESLSTSEMTPNHALQRTAPRVTLAATHHPAAFAHPAPATFPQPARRAPQSLSLGSLGVFHVRPENDTFSKLSYVR